MSDFAPNAELLRSLGRLVRGLSALFWGLPAALVVGIGTARAGWFSHYEFFGFVPCLALTGVLLFGLWQLGAFQKQERPWRSALERARLFAFVNCGLSPFLYWWNRVPEQPFFGAALGVLALSALLFLFDLNIVLQRLGAMLPDEALRLETRQYTTFNRSLLIALLSLAATYLVFSRVLPAYWPQLSILPDPADILPVQAVGSSVGTPDHLYWAISMVLGLLALLPLAMTMALIWKTKEVILDSVFGAKG